MTDIFHQEANAPIEMAIAPEAPRPVSSDWSPTAPASERAAVQTGKTREERRGSINRAVAEVRGRSPSGQFRTKAERLASDFVGSLSQRAAARSSVAKAMEKVGYVPGREETLSARGEMRKAVETLRQRYPDKKASDFVKIAKEWDASYKADPVGTRERILEQYAKVSPENFRDYQEPERAKGARGSVRQAMRDHEMMADLAQFEKEFGGKLPGVLSELVKHDAALVNDPVGTSARLAANYNAPVTPAQEARAYEQQRAAAQHRAQDSANVQRALDLIVQHNVLPHMNDDRFLGQIADVLESKTFQRSGDRLADLKAAHATVMASKTTADRAAGRGNRHYDAGSKSISGAPSPARASREATGVRGSINRAKGRA